jgi:hypothetical protein
MNLDIYVGDDKLRFLLGSSGKKPCFIIGVNPSTATPECPDATIKKVMRFIELDAKHADSHDGFVMLNLYPFRNKDPKNLPLSLNPYHAAQNYQEIRRIFTNMNAPTIWAAWGNVIDSRSYLLDCLEGIVEVVKPFNPKWKSRGDVTLAKNPRHPSRLGFTRKFCHFEIGDYLREKRNV